MGRLSRLRVAAAALVLAGGTAACAPTSGAAGVPGPAPRERIAWVGEDPARGLCVMLEPLPAPARSAAGAVGAEDAFRAALAVETGEALYLLHVQQAAPGARPSPVSWSSGAVLRVPAAREGATRRERLFVEAVAHGGSADRAPFRHVLAGSPPADSARGAEWRGADPPLPLLPRAWNAAERAAFLDVRPAPAASHD